MVRDVEVREGLMGAKVPKRDDERTEEGRYSNTTECLRTFQEG